MCELFGLSSRLPATLSLSLDALASHGDASRDQCDGWVLAAHHGRAIRAWKEARPAASSPWVRFIESQPLCASLVQAHIRHASRGAVALENTHPFVRELGGHSHAFAHNGDVPDVTTWSLRAGRFRPLGDTDSEHAFCTLLMRLEALWLRGTPSVSARSEVVATFARELRALGPANFLYSDGELLFAHADRRRWQGERGARPPGLFLLERHCAPGAATHGGGGMQIAPHPQEQQVVLVASVPLTCEAWQPVAEGELLVIAGGRRIGRSRTAVAPSAAE